MPRLVKAAGCRIWSPVFRDLTDDRLKEAKALGLKVIPWTVNEPADMERLIDGGVDGLITDYPDRLGGAWPPRACGFPRLLRCDKSGQERQGQLMTPYDRDLDKNPANSSR